MSTINCLDLEQLCLACALLTREGVTFRANAGALTITITGF